MVSLSPEVQSAKTTIGSRRGDKVLVWVSGELKDILGLSEIEDVLSAVSSRGVRNILIR